MAIRVLERLRARAGRRALACELQKVSPSEVSKVVCDNSWSDSRPGYKPREVEEPIDDWFHRPLAQLLVKQLLPLPITPNQVTVASGAVGLLAGVTIGIGAAYGSRWVLAGGLVLLLSVLLDCADGQLARLRGTFTLVGRALDGCMDIAAPLSVFVGMGCYLLSVGYSFWPSWPIGLAAGASLAWHAAQYDGVKNVYLHCSRPDFSMGGSTLLTTEDIDAMRRRYQAAGDHCHALVMRVWSGWTRSQARAIQPWLGCLTPRDDQEREIFVRLFRTDMRLWSWLGFGTHMILLELMCWLTVWSELAIWVGWAVMLGPMNLLCLVLLFRRPHLVRRYERELARARDLSATAGSTQAPAAA